MCPDRSFPCWHKFTVHYFTHIFHNPMFFVKIWFQCIHVVSFIRIIFFRTTQKLDVNSQNSFCFWHIAALVTQIQNSFMDALNMSFHIFSCSLSTLILVAGDKQVLIQLIAGIFAVIWTSFYFAPKSVGETLYSKVDNFEVLFDLWRKGISEITLYALFRSARTSCTTFGWSIRPVPSRPVRPALKSGSLI